MAEHASASSEDDVEWGVVPRRVIDSLHQQEWKVCTI
jgi:hypothetical protein